MSPRPGPAAGGFRARGPAILPPEEIVRRTPAGRRVGATFESALRHWVESAPGEAFAWLLAEGDATEIADLADAMLLDWAKTAPLDALGCVLAQPAGDKRDRWLAGVVVGLAEYDPALAGDYACALLPVGEARRRAVEGVAVSWARNDPAAAADWAFSVGRAGGPDVAGLVLYPWFSAARADATRWVEHLPASPERDRLLTRLVGWQMERNPLDAGGLISAISGEELRCTMTTALVRQWAEQDFTAATAWVRGLAAPGLREKLFAELNAASPRASDLRR